MPAQKPAPSAPSSPIHILCSSDDRFAPWCGVMLTSLLHNLAGREAVVHLIDSGIGESQREKLSSLERCYPCRINFIMPSAELLASIPEKVNGWPLANCIRVMATELLPRDLNRVIYLDCDMAVDLSIAPLWDMDLDGKACAVVCDAPLPRHCVHRGELLGITGTYFNAGMMVMDLDCFRRLDIARRSAAIMRDIPPEYVFPDQDIFNLLLQGNHVDLPARWNVQSDHYLRMCHEPHGDERREVEGVLRGEIHGIIHYTSIYKPWKNDINDFHPLEHVWRRYHRISAWADTPFTPARLPLRTRMARWRHAFAYRHRLPSIYAHEWRPIP